MQFNTYFTRKDLKKRKGEINNQPSMTIPNQAMTVRELVIRFASGLPLTGQKVPIYEPDEEIASIDSMDLIEREAYYKSLLQQRQEVEQRVKARRIKAEEMKMEKVIAERIAKKEEEAEKKLIEEYRKNKNNEKPI